MKTIALFLMGAALVGCADQPTETADAASQQEQDICQPGKVTGTHMVDTDCSLRLNVNIMSANSFANMMRQSNQGGMPH